MLRYKISNLLLGDKIILGSKVRTVTAKTENTVQLDGNDLISDRSPLWEKVVKVL